ncbi:MAG: type II toxin-antitoxin system death-on-curing family toxin [Nitrospirae bacterium]|nr:type II toxin-antitoxin system death-on-curing family toxin [Nitrospirota bacterium]MBI3605378.1 type II toxin-antitoxin system death-on-curing family toxin [Nitrospirota bacterium]
MKRISVPTADAIIAVNKLVCEEGGTPHHCNDKGKIESAIHTAFYPGSFPFVQGGIVKVAGALCFYLIKDHPFMDGNKRTGALTAITFLNQHGWDLKYPLNKKTNVNGLAEIIENCAAGKVSKEELMEWFENHKVLINPKGGH